MRRRAGVVKVESDAEAIAPGGCGIGLRVGAAEACEETVPTTPGNPAERVVNRVAIHRRRAGPWATLALRHR